MSILNRLEKRFGRFAITNLVVYLVFFKALVFILLIFNRDLWEFLVIIPERVFAGEVWRLVTFLFVPESGSILFVLFELLILYITGSAVEREWGTFKFNLFYFTGMLGTIIGALFLSGGINTYTTSTYLNLSVFFAFATLFPKHEFLIFFILPVQVRWLALISLIFVIPAFFVNPISVFVAFLNYALFFGPSLIQNLKHRQEVGQRRTEFQAKSMPQHETLHQCTRCGRTERDDPHLEFRVSARDNEEYCLPCLEEIRRDQPETTIQ